MSFGLLPKALWPFKLIEFTDCVHYVEIIIHLTLIRPIHQCVTLKCTVCNTRILGKFFFEFGNYFFFTFFSNCWIIPRRVGYKVWKTSRVYQYAMYNMHSIHCVWLARSPYSIYSYTTKYRKPTKKSIKKYV